MNADELGIALCRAGLLQFGRFVVDGVPQPFQHHLAMLASYPGLLAATVKLLAPQVQHVDRLLCSDSAIPLGVALGLETGIPLVIGRGSGHDGARDFVGAFDIGHPATLVANSLGDGSTGLVHHAQRFGLDVQQVIAVLDGRGTPQGVPDVAVLSLQETVRTLVENKQLPAGLGRAVETWLGTYPIRPRRG